MVDVYRGLEADKGDDGVDVADGLEGELRQARDVEDLGHPGRVNVELEADLLVDKWLMLNRSRSGFVV